MINKFLVKASNLLSDAKFDQIDRAEKLIWAGYLPIYDKGAKQIQWIPAVLNSDSEPLFGDKLIMKKVNKDTAKSIFSLINVEPEF